jgi:TolB-like protein
MVSTSRNSRPSGSRESPKYRYRGVCQAPSSFPTSPAAMGLASHFNPKHGLECVRAGGELNDKAAIVAVVENMPVLETPIPQQLARILQSRVFVQSERLSRFLRFIVEHTINGNQNCVKEYVIGSEVYDRKPPYNPSQDSIVRTEARRLRGKLKEYYEAEGKEDPVYVYLRPGSYVPVFQFREDLIGSQSTPQQKTCSLLAKSSVPIAILPFNDISGNAVSSIYARGLADELGYCLMRTAGCTVISSSSIARASAQECDIPRAMSKVGAQIAYEASVRVEGKHLRVTARIVDGAGLQLWVKRVDAAIGTKTSFAMQEQVASELSAGFDALFGHHQRMNTPLIVARRPLEHVSHSTIVQFYEVSS